jgi:hypothetical protein
MIDPIELQREFFEGLTTIDAAIVERAAKEPCRDCGGPCIEGDYPRKPRGRLVASALPQSTIHYEQLPSPPPPPRVKPGTAANQRAKPPADGTGLAGALALFPTRSGSRWHCPDATATPTTSDETGRLRRRSLDGGTGYAPRLWQSCIH